MKILHRAAIYLIVVLSLQLTVYTTLAYLLAEADRVLQKSDYARTYIAALIDLTRKLWLSITSLSLYAHYRDKGYAEQFEKIAQSMQSPLHIQEFQIVFSNPQADPEDAQQLQQLIMSTKLLIEELEKSKHFYEAYRTGFGWIYLHRKFSHQFAPHSFQIRSEMGRAMDKHVANLQPAKEARLKRAIQVFFWITLFCNILLSLFLLIAFSRGITNRLRVTKQNMGRLVAGQTLLPAVGGTDEISQLDQALHDMSTALAEAEAKDRTLLANMPVGLFTCASNMTIEDVNQRACELLQASKTSLLDLKIDQIMDLGAARIEAIAESATLIRSTCTLSSAKESPFDVSIAKFEHDGQIKYLVSIMDAHERATIDRLKHQFMSMVSDDLTDPLEAIATCLSHLHDSKYGELSPSGLKATSMAVGSVDRLLQLTKDLIDLANIESGVLYLEKRLLRVTDVLDRSLADVSALAANKSIHLRKQDTALGNATALLDERRIIQILVNLLSNAIKFSEPNQEVVLTAEVIERNLCFSVEDHGRGIPMEQLDHIFERFKQVRKEDVFIGTGLGLPICKMLAETHGGKITVRSKVGVGTTFDVTVPIET